MSNYGIASINARQIFSDRGNLAVEATVTTAGGHVGKAVCTAGLSVGKHEVAFAYDNETRWMGIGVGAAVNNIKGPINDALRGMDVRCQREVDYAMMELAKKTPLGGNATAAVSAAVLKAGSIAAGIPLYRHIGGEDAVTMPLASFGCFYGSSRYDKLSKGGGKPTCSFIAYDFSSFSEAAEALGRVYALWKDTLWQKYGIRQSGMPETSVFSGFFNIPAGFFNSDEEIWALAGEVIAKCGYENRIGLQLDVAASSFFDPKTGLYNGLFSPKPMDMAELMDYYGRMISNFPIVVLEDPLNEDDFEGTAVLTKHLGIQIVGDDLFTTNPMRLRIGIEAGAANTVLLKVNQVGTITKALEMVELAYRHGYGVMPCLSRGEREAIADYSVGINAATIRECAFGSAGARLREIERELGSKAIYLGRKALKGWRFQGDDAK
jgi:enolase